MLASRREHMLRSRAGSDGACLRSLRMTVVCGALAMLTVGCSDSVLTGLPPRHFSVERRMDVTPPGPTTVTLGFRNPNSSLDSISLTSYPAKSFIELTVSGLITSTRYDGVKATYGPIGDNRGGRTLVRVWHSDGTWDGIESSDGVPTPDSAHTTWVDSGIVLKGNAFAERASSTGDGTCGTKPCYAYSGSQTFTVRYIPVGLTVTTSPDSVPSPGGVTSVAALPAYLFHGAAIPDSIEDWRWIPRGGIPFSPADSANKCPHPGQPASAYCYPHIYVTGTLYADAIVNGYSQTGSVKIRMPCPTGDTALDNHPALEDKLLDLLGQEWQAADPYNSNVAARQEYGGVTYQDSTGTWQNYMDPQGSGTPCGGSISIPSGIHGHYWETHDHPDSARTPAYPTCSNNPHAAFGAGPSDTDFKYLPDSATGLVMDYYYMYRYDQHSTLARIPRFNKSKNCRVI